MTRNQIIEGRNASFAPNSRVLGLLFLAATIGCGGPSAPVVRGGSGGSGGEGGRAGTGGCASLFSCGGTGGSGGGAAGSGGTAGTSGMAGSGGTSGTAGAGGTGGSGGTAGAGGSGGSAGVGGTGGTVGECATNALCHTCPDRFLCSTDANCFPGYKCIPSGCETHGGAAIKQCQPSKAPSCANISECPNSSDYECGPVGESLRCLRVTSGCNPSTESYDCAPGFSCEGGACVDRRVPCRDFSDCPKSHVCRTEPSASYCVRVYRTCHRNVDCAGFGDSCVNVDGDVAGIKECTGELVGSGTPCTNQDCTDPSEPVCDTAGTGTTATCGNHGLCLSQSDCGTGFECLGLWQDGRKECVPIDGGCSQVSQCPLQQVCASSRNGGAPTCQSGSAS